MFSFLHVKYITYSTRTRIFWPWQLQKSLLSSMFTFFIIIFYANILTTTNFNINWCHWFRRLSSTSGFASFESEESLFSSSESIRIRLYSNSLIIFFTYTAISPGKTVHFILYVLFWGSRNLISWFLRYLFKFLFKPTLLPNKSIFYQNLDEVFFQTWKWYILPSLNLDSIPSFCCFFCLSIEDKHCCFFV